MSQRQYNKFMNEATFSIGALRLVGAALSPDSPPLGVGDQCALNSGGPELLVVDVSMPLVVVSWRGDNGIIERTFPRECVRRIPREA